MAHTNFSREFHGFRRKLTILFKSEIFPKTTFCIVSYCIVLYRIVARSLNATDRSKIPSSVGLHRCWPRPHEFEQIRFCQIGSLSSRTILRIYDLLFFTFLANCHELVSACNIKKTSHTHQIWQFWYMI